MTKDRPSGLRKIAREADDRRPGRP